MLRNLSSKWTGPVAVCKGASSQQTQEAASQQQFYNTLSSDYNTQFANQSAILGSLTNALSSTLQAGPNQYGYSAAETGSLNSSALQGTGQSYANASKSLKENQAAQGGGNVALPSGVASQQQAQLAASAANQESSSLLGIQQQGYQQGAANYNNAVNALGGVASQYNPTGYAGSATSAGSSAYGSATTNQQMNNAASPWNVLGGVIGGVAQGFGGALGSGISGGQNAVQSGYGSDPFGVMGAPAPVFGMGGMGGMTGPDLSAF